MTTASPYYEIGAQTLIVLRDRLRPFVEEAVQERYPDGWREMLGLQRAAGSRLGASGPQTLDDPDWLVGYIANRQSWESVFEPKFNGNSASSYEARDLCRDIRRQRGRYALHTSQFTDGDAWRLIDSTRRLLAIFRVLDEESASKLDQLARLVQPGTIETERELELLRVRYLGVLANRLEHIDLGGIAPSVGGHPVRLRLDDIYLTPAFKPMIEARASSASSLDPNARITEELARIRPAGQPPNQPPAASLLENRCVLLIGGPGAGKSTFTKFVARSLALGTGSWPDIDGSTPILLGATAFAETLRHGANQSLYGFIRNELTDGFGPMLAAEIDRGRAIVFIDGVDEVGDAPTRARLGQAIDQFASEHGDVRVVATARPVGYREIRLGTAFVPYAIQPLNDTQIASFVQGWYRAIEPEKNEDERAILAMHLVAEITATPAIRDLAGTPLLLTIIALVALRGGSLPSRRIELFRIVTQTLLRQWPMSHGYDLDEFELRLVLGRVAGKIVPEGGRLLRKDDLRRLFEAELVVLRGLDDHAARPAADIMIRTIEEQTGFLVEQGIDTGEPVYGFIHRSFAEYLAALDLFEQYNAGMLTIGDFALDSRWGDAARMFFAHAAESSMELATALVHQLLELNPPFERFVHRRVSLALALLGDGVRVRPAVRDEAMLLGAHIALQSQYNWQRRAFLRALAHAATSAPSGLDPRAVLEEVDDAIGPSIRRAYARWSLRGSNRTEEDVRDFVESVRGGLLAGDPDVMDTLWASLLDLDSIRAGEPDTRAGDDQEPRWVLSVSSQDGSSDTIEVTEATSATLSAAGVAACSVADLVLAGGLPPGFDPELFLTDLSDASLPEVAEILHLAADQRLHGVASSAAKRRTWNDLEIAEAMRLVDLDDTPKGVVALVVDVCVPYLLDAALKSPTEVIPDWIDDALARPGAIRFSTLLGAMFAPATARARAPGSADLVGKVLSHPNAEVREFALRGFLDAEPWSDDGVGVSEDTLAALELAAETDENPNVRAAAWRARLVAGKSIDPLVKALGEDGATRQPESMLSMDQFAHLIVWLLWLSTDEQRARDGHLLATQLGKILDWNDKPHLSEEDVWFAAGFTPADGVPFNVPKVVAEAAWERVRSTDPVTRSWAAAAWAMCGRARPAKNEIAILLGDSEGTARMAGLMAIHEFDVGDGVWIAEAVELSLREDDDGDWEVLARLGFGPDSDYTRTLLSVVRRVLESGVTSGSAMALIAEAM